MDENQALLHYFDVKPVIIGDFIEEWDNFVNDYLNESNLKNLLAFLHVESVRDVNPHDYYELSDSSKRFFADYLIETGIERERIFHDPINAPAWMLLTPRSNGLIPTTKLVHYTDHGNEIMRDGFQLGVPDPDRIALTYINDIWGNRVRSSGFNEPGYNAAYIYNTYVKHAHHSGYGQEAIIFESTGVECHHSGDRELQVFFWGPAVDRSTIKKISL